VRASEVPELDNRSRVRGVQWNRSLPGRRAEPVPGRPGLFGRRRLRLSARHVRYELSNVCERTALLGRVLRVRRNLVFPRLLQRQHMCPCRQPNDGDVRRRSQRVMQGLRWAGMRQRRMLGQLLTQHLLQ
jgi:hypothetical protein